MLGGLCLAGALHGVHRPYGLLPKVNIPRHLSGFAGVPWDALVHSLRTAVIFTLCGFVKIK